MMHWLKHAFAIEPPKIAEPTPAQRELIDRLCREVARRRLTTPALVLLESWRPLHYVGAQVMHFFAPMLAVVFTANQHEEFARFLEQRGAVEYLTRRLEQVEREGQNAAE